jgi:dCMP deaminase
MDWDTYFMQMLPMIATKSKDMSTKVGCIIVGPDHEIRSTGYNSFPRGLNDNIPERQERPEKYKWIEHAERNAIYNAARMGISLKECYMYIMGVPCMDCGRAIIQAGIVEVIYDNNPENPFEKNGRWVEQMKTTLQMFDECCIKYRAHNVIKWI